MIAAIPDIGLGKRRPDFVLCANGIPKVVIEAKNAPEKLSEAISQAIEYAEIINSNSDYQVNFAVGAAGEEQHGFVVETKYLVKGEWVPLRSKGYEITTIPSKREVELALLADDGSTTVEVPAIEEFIDAAVELSAILRLAKVEAPLRPKVIGALVLALYEGNIAFNDDNPLHTINELIESAIAQADDLAEKKKCRLKEALELYGADYERLSPYIGRIVHLLRGLNIRAVLQTDTDFLGIFYEAFLRYGYDNNALGIVFTPRHITRFCANLASVQSTDRVIDVACGTGGFLVAAFDKMMQSACGAASIHRVKQSLFGFDTNPTIWALATLNMFFRGDGKSHIENRSCFEAMATDQNPDTFSVSFLNPPFSQIGEPERDFIDVSMRQLQPQGLFVGIIKAGLFADNEHNDWRRQFLRGHSVLAVISMPDDLFYPTAAPTTILVAKAHVPHAHDARVFVAKVWNDGFEKLKGRRVSASGSQLQGILDAFNSFSENSDINQSDAVLVSAEEFGRGSEWSPQRYLPQPTHYGSEIKKYKNDVSLSIFRAVANLPSLSDAVETDFTKKYAHLPELEVGLEAPLSDFFEITNGRSQGEKNYNEGEFPYVSSGDQSNSVVRLVEAQHAEVFAAGAITVTAFGQACVQPWNFVARGNGGSSVRVLIPTKKINFNDLLWFAAQINLQRWRFFYGRMAIKSRLGELRVTSPNITTIDTGKPVWEKIKTFKDTLLSEASFN